MQKIKQKQRDKIYEEFEKKIPRLLYKWKSVGEFGRDIDSYTDEIKSILKLVLDYN